MDGVRSQKSLDPFAMLWSPGHTLHVCRTVITIIDLKYLMVRIFFKQFSKNVFSSLFSSTSCCSLTGESHDHANRTQMLSRCPVILPHTKTMVGCLLVLPHHDNAASCCACWGSPAYSNQSIVLSSLQARI